MTVACDGGAGAQVGELQVPVQATRDVKRRLAIGQLTGTPVQVRLYRYKYTIDLPLTETQAGMYSRPQRWSCFG
jgi:hypothetical protein